MVNKINIMILTVAIFFTFFPSYAFTYILPAKQIIEFMTNRFSAVRALKIIQTIKVTDMAKGLEYYDKNIMFIKSPSLYRSEISGQHGKNIIIFNGDESLNINEGLIIENHDIYYPFSQFLFVAQEPNYIIEKLSDLGINVEKTSLTRLDNKIAYRIGEREMEHPIFIVDKEHFLPLFLKYGDSTIHFTDYRDLMEKHLYPYHITRSSKYITEEYTISGIMINPPIDLSQFDIPLIRSRYPADETKKIDLD